MELKRITNFNAGPSAIPLNVLQRVYDKWFNYEGYGMAVMEMSHRSKIFDDIHNRTISLVKQLLDLSDDYHVLFLQGGASLQFAMLPMNILTKSKSADYLDTGSWSTAAIKETKLFGKVNLVFDGSIDKYMRLPKMDEIKLSKKAEYVHITSNNTIKGTQFFEFPKTGDIPLVCDMSSDIMSRKLDINQFAMVYAGAQKNLGPSGVTLVIIRDDMLKKMSKDTTSMLNYHVHLKKNSLFNTPNTFGIYLMGEVLQWIVEQGGVQDMEDRNREKAELLYEYIDENGDFFSGPVEKSSRSWMNVCFRLPNEELEAKFAQESVGARLSGLKGHRSVGGLRASIYNTASLRDVKTLITFLKAFKKRNIDFL